MYFVRYFEVAGVKSFGDTVYFAMDSTTFYRKDSVGNVYKRENGVDQLYYKMTATQTEKWIVNFSGQPFEMSLERDSAYLQTESGLLRYKVFRYHPVGYGADLDKYFRLVAGLGLFTYQTSEEYSTLTRAVIDGSVFGGAFHVFEVFPRQGDRNVDIGATVQFRFDTIVDTNLVAQKVTVSSKKGGQIPGAVHFARDVTQRFTFYPSERFLRSDTVTVRIFGDMLDIFGKCFDGNRNGRCEGSPLDDYTWTFSTQIVTGVEDREPTIPSGFLLQQNYPNPFNSQTTVQYSIPNKGLVTIQVYNVVGQRVRRLISEAQESGTHQVVWDARDDAGRILSSGLYLVEVRWNNKRKVIQTIYLK